MSQRIEEPLSNLPVGFYLLPELLNMKGQALGLFCPPPLKGSWGEATGVFAIGIALGDIGIPHLACEAALADPVSVQHCLTQHCNLQL